MMFASRPRTPFVFEIAELERLGTELHAGYVAASPFPHVVLDDFLPKEYADSVLDHYPGPDSEIWLDWTQRDTVHQPKKLGIGHASRMTDVSPYVLTVLQAFNSYPFLNFLEKLTGIEKLLSDPYFHGGGLHQILSGGKLAIHTDFNDLKRLDLYRRLNVLLYLNKNWKDEYNGQLELWSQDMQRCERTVAPVFNRLVVFNTNKRSFHGHPKPLNTPPHITRKSLAFYYYTAQPAADQHYDHHTDWQEVPSA